MFLCIIYLMIFLMCIIIFNDFQHTRDFFFSWDDMWPSLHVESNIERVCTSFHTKDRLKYYEYSFGEHKDLHL